MARARSTRASRPFSAERFEVSLRVYGETLVHAEVTAALGCKPTLEVDRVARMSDGTERRIAGWILRLDSRDCPDGTTPEDAVGELLDMVTDRRQTWAKLTKKYEADLFCGVYLERGNQGFGIPPELSKALHERNLPIGFDIYAPATGRSRAKPRTRRGTAR